MKYHIVTLGCPKNVVDSEGMQSILQASGHTLVEDYEYADVIIVNTCSFIKPAREETLLVLRELGQRKRPSQRLIAAGCMAESHAPLLQAISGVDTTLSTRAWTDIDALIAAEPMTSEPLHTTLRQPDDLPLRDLPPPTDWRNAPIQRHQHAPAPSAYIKIADGCNLRCAFCTIPAIKGDLRSKSVADVVHEAETLVAQGGRELVLVAQNLTDYGKDRGERDGLATLLETLCAALPSHIWLRLMYVYPQGITPRLVATMANSPQVCAYLDMPLQHADPDVLQRMHRPTDGEQTRQVIGMLREAMPAIAIRSTFLVGFPGETGESFQRLLDFLEELQFDWVGVFRYSREPGTPSATYAGQVKSAIIERRWHRVMQLQQHITQAKQSRWQGNQLDILIEGHTQLDDGRMLLVGRSYREAPEVDGQVLVWGSAEVGEVVPVRIVQTAEYDMWGEIAKGEDSQTA